MSNGHALFADFGRAQSVERAGATQLAETRYQPGTANDVNPERPSVDAEIDFAASPAWSVKCSPARLRLTCRPRAAVT